jgi:heme exporter protein D
MSPIEEFFHMGGYAIYVWPSYAIFAVVFIANVVQPIIARRAITKRLARQQRLNRRAS